MKRCKNLAYAWCNVWKLMSQLQVGRNQSSPIPRNWCQLTKFNPCFSLCSSSCNNSFGGPPPPPSPGVCLKPPRPIKYRRRRYWKEKIGDKWVESPSRSYRHTTRNKLEEGCMHVDATRYEINSLIIITSLFHRFSLSKFSLPPSLFSLKKYY